MIRNRIFLALAILVSGIYVGCQGGAIPYMIFYGLVLLPLMSAFYVFLVYYRFRIYQKIDNKVLVKEERVPYLFQLANEGILTYTRIKVNFMKDYSSIELLDQSKDYCLIPKDVIKRETVLCCHIRGEYKVGIDYVTVRDYLNLFQFTYACQSVIQVKVLPRVLHLSHLAAAPKIEDVKKQQYYIQARQEVPDVEVRKYQSQDDPKRIHWKATARTGQLLTRKYTEEPKTEIILIADLRRSDLGEKERMITEDKILEALLASADFFVRNQAMVSVIIDSGGIKEKNICGKNDFQELYAHCSEMYFKSEVSSEQLLYYTKNRNQNHQYCMLITGQMDENLCRSAYEYIESGNELSIIMIGSVSSHELVEKMTDRVKLYQIELSQEVREVLEKV